jgi:uroporphyrinogen-III synthase
MRVAITRAPPDNARTAERLRERGGEPVLAPLLTIVPCGYDTNTDDAQAIIFTSSNGVRAFPDVVGARDRIVLTVGDVTAEAARDAGFTDVRSADGDVESLAALAHTSLDPAKGKLIHIAGDHVAGDLSGALRAAGFVVERRFAYASVAASALPDVFNTQLDAVTFHSARAAATFVALGAPGAPQLAAACFSQNVADAASAAPWKRLIVSPAPRDEALLDALFSG